MAQDKIRGEYARVSKLTQEHRLLLKAHRTAVGNIEATEMIHGLSGVFGFSIPEIYFRAGSRGKCKYDRIRKVYRITLPKDPISDDVVIGRLRTGIVLHEYAHLVDSMIQSGIVREALDELCRTDYAGIVQDAFRKRITGEHPKTLGHGLRFVRILDALLRMWETYLLAGRFGEYDGPSINRRKGIPDEADVYHV